MHQAGGRYQTFSSTPLHLDVIEHLYGQADQIPRRALFLQLLTMLSLTNLYMLTLL